MKILKKVIVFTRLNLVLNLLLNLYSWFFRYHEVTRNGIKYKLDLKESVDRGIFLFGWEPLTISWLNQNLKKGDTVIEVGANVGAHSLTIASIIGQNGSLYCFEPTHYAFDKLQKNFLLNPTLMQNTELIQAYVSNNLAIKSENKLRSSWIINKTDEEADKMDENFNGEIISLDSYFCELKNLNFIKIDVDGFDFKVLQGATNLISTFRPLVFIELGETDLNKNGDSITSIVSYFDELNYEGVLENGVKIKSGELLIKYLKDVSHSNAIFTPN